MNKANSNVKSVSFTPGVILSSLVAAAVLAAAAAFAISSRETKTVEVNAVKVADIRFAVQPIMNPEATRAAYQPLADYLSKMTGKTIELVTSNDYLDYWVRMKSGREFNLVLDAPFYTDYRIQKQGHAPLVKVPGSISNSLVSLSSSGILDVSELVGKEVAIITPPSPTSLILQRLFPNASRQPLIVAVKSSEQAIEMVLNGKAQAALVPTPLAAQAMESGKDLYTIVTTDPIPHIAFTAGPEIDTDTRQKLTKALLEATQTPEGQEILKAIGFADGFEPASAELYLGYSKHLYEQW